MYAPLFYVNGTTKNQASTTLYMYIAFTLHTILTTKQYGSIEKVYPIMHHTYTKPPLFFFLKHSFTQNVIRYLHIVLMDKRKWEAHFMSAN